MPKKSKIIYLIITILFFIFFDTYFSNLIIRYLSGLPENPVMDLIFVQNTGAAFSILQNSKIFLIIFAIFAMAGIIFYTFKHIEKASTITLFWTSMLIAGVFCNMYERVAFGYVRDFFKLKFVDFPVFNISDVFINVSVFAIVIIIISHEIINRRINRRKKN